MVEIVVASLLGALLGAVLGGGGVYFACARHQGEQAVEIANLKGEIKALRDWRHEWAGKIEAAAEGFLELKRSVDETDRRLSAIERPRRS